MKVVILAGGFGTRFGSYTKKVPKPLILINKIPIIQYIVEHYYKLGHNEFIICSGYLHQKILNFTNL